jgi:hypothetical protein
MQLFAGATIGLETRRIDPLSSTLGSPIERDDARPDLRGLAVSSPERAILEVLDEIPRTVGFDHGRELFEGLTALRPRLVTTLLKGCTSVKAKRLFLYFTSRQNYPWVGAITASGIDLGSGKRQIVAGGKLDKNYLITVPAEHDQEQAGER